VVVAYDRYRPRAQPAGLRARFTGRIRAAAARRTRLRLADGLTRALRSAQEPTAGFTAAIRPHAEETVAARSVLLALDRRLRGEEPVSQRGLTMIHALLTDGNSALYRPPEPGALGSHLRAAAAALDPGAGEPS
jgi:hypothetical protein